MTAISSESPPLDFELALKGKRIFVTGHTGFTGGWLVSWLKRIGCDVAGLALAPLPNPTFLPRQASPTASCRPSAISAISPPFGPLLSDIDRPSSFTLPRSPWFRNPLRIRSRPLPPMRWAPLMCSRRRGSRPTSRPSSASPPTRFIVTRIGSGAIASRIRSAARIPTALRRPAPNWWRLPIAQRWPSAAMAC